MLSPNREIQLCYLYHFGILQQHWNLQLQANKEVKVCNCYTRLVNLLASATCVQTSLHVLLSGKPLSTLPYWNSRWRTACVSWTICPSNWRPKLPPSSAASQPRPNPSAGVRARATPAPSAASARRASRRCRRWDGKTPRPRGFFLMMTIQ